MDLVKLSKKGISRGALNHLMKHCSLTLHQMAALLPVTVRTIQRYATEDRFSPPVSEQIISIAHILSRGEQVFGNCTQWMTWMNHKNPALSDKKPFDPLSSRFGADLIIDELGRIERGAIF